MLPTASALRQIQAIDFRPAFSQTAARQRGMRGFQRKADLLAASFEEGVIST